MSMKSPTSKPVLMPPEAFVTMSGLHAELLQHIDRIGDLVRRVALVAVQAALHTDNAAARERTADQTAGVVGRGRNLEERNVAVRNADRLLDFLRERPRPEPRTMPISGVNGSFSRR